MTLQEIKSLDKKYFMNTFGERTPVAFEYGKGMYLWDIEGKKYLDMLAGIAVSSLGHAHPALTKAIQEQSSKLIHCSSLYYIESQAKLAQLLVENSCADKVFFANSGAEANEGALKLARLYFKKKGLENKTQIITLNNSFHGRTMDSNETTTKKANSFISVPVNDLQTIEKAINKNTCAVMIEPIQGESGVNIITAEFLQGVRKLCTDNDVLLIFDEVQCGIGRTGKLFGYQHSGVEPDIFTLAKALAGGMPIGALCAKDFVACAFEPGDHGSTFGGNPLACSAAIATLTTILNDNLVENSYNMGMYLKEELNKLKDKHPIIKEIRGEGLMIGIQLSEDTAKEINRAMLKKGVLVGNVGKSIIRVLPPLIVTKDNIDEFISAFDEVLK